MTLEAEGGSETYGFSAAPPLPLGGAGSSMTAVILLGQERQHAIELIRCNHYTHSVPSGKSHYVGFGNALVVWSIPANKNIAKFILGWPGKVWELSRLWAPDGHARNLLTQAISAAVEVIKAVEKPDALVSYADPNAGHKGGVYRAASWIYHGQAEETRTYRGSDGQTVARRAFHSGQRGMKKAEIEASGFTELKLPGKERFVRPLSRKARKVLAAAEREKNSDHPALNYRILRGDPFQNERTICQKPSW